MTEFTKGWFIGVLTSILTFVPLYYGDLHPAPVVQRQLVLVEPAKKPVDIFIEDRVLKNGCYLAATGFRDAYEAQMQLNKRAHWSHLIYVEAATLKIEGHAVCAFEYGGRLKIYDSAMGTMDICPFDKTQLPNVEDIVKQFNPNYSNAKWYK